MNKKGFTLVELLAVISILGVVAILAIPTLLSALDKGKKLSKQYDEEGIVEAAKMYLIDLDNGVKTITYSGSNITVNNKTVKNGDVLSGYDLKVYLIQKGGINVTMKTLVEGGYYDDDCDYTNNPGRCEVPSDCTIKVSLNYSKSNDGIYYTTTGYTAYIVDSSKCQ